MQFLSEKDDVITAVLSKPAKAAAPSLNTDDTPHDTNRFCGVPNGTVRSKIKIRKAGEVYRTETTAGIQVFHGKLESAELESFFAANIPAFFKNAVIETATETITILANKKGKCTVLRKTKANVRGADERASFGAEMREADVPVSFAANVHESAAAGKSSTNTCGASGRGVSSPAAPANEYNLRTRFLEADKTTHLTETHNRQKNYLLKEGAPIDFLVKLGIMTKDGKIHAQKYSKFRQINRFLEYVDDILPSLTAPEKPDCAKMMDATGAPETGASQESGATRTLEIVDFGCGKSYLTFAVYYYLTAIKGFNAHITGIDLKKDVIHNCERLAAACGYIGMEFICGDVADFSCSTPPDLVITLHACDTATDYALSYAVKNGAKCILSVPCCQHELNTLLKKHVPNDALSAMFKYGIIKERISALATDVMRAELLENSGYSTQILEFIDIEDTPKNLLIRAIKRDKPARNSGNAQKTAPTEEQLAKPHIQKSDLSALQAALGQTITLEKLLSQ